MPTPGMVAPMEPAANRSTRWRAAADRALDALESHPRAALAAYALLLLIQVGPWWYASKDDCLYISIARSMVRGETVACLGDERITVGPGWPALLSPAFLTGERPFLAMGLIQWGVSLALILGLFRWCLRHDPRRAVLLTGLCVMNLTIWYYFRRPLKEIVFLTTLVWSVNLFHPLCEVRPWRTTAALCAAGCAVLSFGLFIRLTGVVLAPAFAVAVAWQARHGRLSWTRAITLAAVVCATAGGSVLWQVNEARKAELASPGRLSYASGFSRNLSEATGVRLLNGVRDRVGEVGRIVIPGALKVYGEPGGGLNPVEFVFLVTTGVVAIGWWSVVRNRIELMALMLPMFAGIYALNAVNQGARLAVAMSPVLFLCAWEGMKRIGRCDTRVLGGWTAAHLAAAAIYWLGTDLPRAVEAHQQWAAVDRIVSTVGEDDVAFGPKLKTARSQLIVAFDRAPPDVESLDEVNGDVAASPEVGAAAPQPPKPDWIITRVRDEVRGYDLQVEEGGLRLWRARDAAPLQIATPKGMR